MNEEVVQHLAAQLFEKEFCDPEMDPEAFVMRRNFTHQYLKGLHVIVSPELNITVWATDVDDNTVVILHQCTYNAHALLRIINWIGK